MSAFPMKTLTVKMTVIDSDQAHFDIELGDELTYGEILDMRVYMSHRVREHVDDEEFEWYLDRVRAYKPRRTFN